MAKHSGSIQFLDLEGFQASRHQPLQIRVEELFRRAIFSGNLGPDSRVPSSRLLARDLKISRHTVERAFDQLVADGFLVRRRGSGTFVSRTIPERERSPAARKKLKVQSGKGPDLSARGSVIAGYPGHRSATIGVAFTPSIPALDLFPRQVWARLLARAVGRSGHDSWAYGASGGLPELQRAIAAHVGASRGVSCEPEQIIVTSSAQQALDLVARALLNPGDAVWVEDPCYQPALLLLRAAGARVSAVPVDSDGFDLARAGEIEPAARLAYITPSHQYPSGGLMSIPRREALLGWAERQNGWIVEDDYDGDLRYTGRPLAALQALDSNGRVIYIGTFNKMMFSSLRIAYLVAPPALLDPFLAAKHMMDGHAPGHTQSALAEFIEKGHLATHLRRLLPEYDRRRLALLNALHSHSDRLEVGSSGAGLHLAVYLRGPGSDRVIAEKCARQGVDLHPLSRFYVGPPRPGFVMGFACSRPPRTVAAMRVVAKALHG